jgi:hypothetical protein
MLKKTRGLWIAACIALLVFGAANAAKKGTAMPSPQGDLVTVKGKVTGISLTAHTLAINAKGHGFISFKLTDRTVYKNAESAGDVKKGESVTVYYRPEGADNVAHVVSMNLVSLPKGISEIKTGELAVELAKGDPNVILIDARPASKYNEEHIPGAVSIPYTDLKDKGADLLPAEKDAAMVFYCGGPT